MVSVSAATEVPLLASPNHTHSMYSLYSVGGGRLAGLTPEDTR